MMSIRLNRFCRASFLLAVLLGFTAAARADLSAIFTNANATASKAIPRRASIILIQCDGLGYGDLSCYGQTKFQTPNLDKLAAGGMRFTNFYSVSAASSPARAALMTGKDAEHLKQRADVNVALSGDETTVAQILKNSGYHTGLIGEWVLGDETTSGAPWRKGFDEFAGYFDPADAENVYADYIFRYAPKSILNPTNNQFETYSGREMLYPNTGGKHGKYLPDLLTLGALNFIKNNLPDQFNKYQPFFLALNYKIPGDKISVPTDAPFSSETWSQAEKNKAAIITRLDGYIGQIVEQLQKSGMTNNVAIFFTSDTIPKKIAGVDPKFFNSFASTNDLLVPMIANWPEKIPAGKVSGFTWTAADFLPTAAEIAYTKPPENIDGVSVLPTLQGKAQPGQYETAPK